MSSAAMNEAVHEYIAREGFRLSNKDAAEIGPELLAMEKLTDAEAVVHVREHRQMKLHDHLLWHDQSAGELYRQQQMKYFRQAIALQVKDADGNLVETRAFYKIKVTTLDPGDTRRYGRGLPAYVGASIATVKASEAACEELLRQAKRDVASFAKRYREYREVFSNLDPGMQSLFEAIDSIEARTKPETNGHQLAGEERSGVAVREVVMT